MVIIETPKRHIIGWNCMAILVEIGQAVRPGREPKKPRKARKETYAAFTPAQQVSLV